MMANAGTTFDFDPAQLSEEEVQQLPSLDENAPATPPAGPAPKVAHVVVPRADAGDAASTSPAADSDVATATPERGPAHPRTERSIAAVIPTRARLTAPLAWFGRMLYAIADRTLGILNLPLSHLAPKTRDVIGVIAAGTIILAIASAYVKPMLFPNADPVGDLQRLLSAPSEKPADSGAPASPPAAHG